MKRHVELDEDTTASALKERVYVSIVALAILLALADHAHLTASQAAAALAIGVGASVLASVLADFIAHIAAHRQLPSGEEATQVVRSASGALLVIVGPLVLLGLCGSDVLSIEAALEIGKWVIVISLGLITYLAVRRSQLAVWAKVGLLLVMVAFGAVVIGLQVLAHA